MEAPEHADEWQRIAGDTQVLLRSRIEIVTVLQSLVDGGLPLVSQHRLHEHLFVARLREVCAERNFIVIGYSENKIANAEVFAAGSVLFQASHAKGGVSFMASNPVDLHDPVEAIRFDFPGELMIAQRRVHKRIRTVPGTTLSCLADSGGITPFDASIVDVSMAGIGVMVYDPSIRLAPGTRLAACRVELPDGSVAVVDVVIVHATHTVLADGRPACRAGCRFIGDAARIDKLLKFFVLDLEDRDGAGSD